MRHRSALPARAGVGFKPEHFQEITLGPQPVGLFEVHAENYMGDGGVPHAQLDRIRRDYALSIHGVGLSIGSPEPLEQAHLRRLNALCDRFEPDGVSEHLAWSMHNGTYLNDLLPLPYTEATLESAARNVDEVQSVLRRQILIENPATYVQFSNTTMPETEFLDRLARKTGCGLLLDVNNVFVSCRNHGADPLAYIRAFALHHVGEIHLAGHDVDVDDSGAPLLIDAHGSPVAEAVWALYRAVAAMTGPIPTIIERDNNVPPWPALLREAVLAQAILDDVSQAVA